MTVTVIFYLVVLFDQLTKWWAVHKLSPIGEIELIPGALYFKYATNDGMAFGMLSDHRWVFLVMTAVIIAVILVFLLKTKRINKHPMLSVSLGLVLGGGVSNMIDRTFFGTELFAGHVVDFIDFRLINFAVFNVADSAVCIGEALLIIYILFVDNKLKNSKYFTFSALDEQDKKGGKSIENTAEKNDE